MTKDDLKAWRESLKLSQKEAADLLNCSSRFIYMRWENGDTDLPATLADRMAKAGETLATDPMAGKKARWMRRFYTLDGHEVTRQHVTALPLNSMYYDTFHAHNTEEITNHQLANLMVKDPASKVGARAMYFQVNTVTWRVRSVAWANQAGHPEHLKQLDAQLEAKRASLDSPQGMFANQEQPQ